jgi:uncharacterized protein (DUF2384 family)
MNQKTNNYPINIDSTSLVNEPISLYLPASFSKNMVLDNLTQNSKQIFVKVLAVTELTIKNLAENIFEITPKTFIKYKNNETKIPSRIAELAIELSALYDLGILIFGNASTFNLWLDKETIYFNNNKPSNYLNTSTGIHLIYEELKRIEFGATA